MSFRIIGGKFKNQVLVSPTTDATRPTAAQLKKSVFDICQAYITDASFLDIFAGSGAVGIEALSRGAAHSTFIETHPAALKCLSANIQKLKLESETEVLRLDAHKALEKIKERKMEFDIIYVDPPYQTLKDVKEARFSHVMRILLFIDSTKLLKPNGRLFIEEAFPPIIPIEELQLLHLKHVDTRRSGKAALHQFVYSSD